MQNITIIAGFLTSLAISLAAIPSIITVALKKGLYGLPRDGGPEKVPTLGGLAIFAGAIVTLNLYADIALLPILPYITTGTLVLFFVGIKDDIVVTAPWWKLTGQILAALVVSLPGGLRIHDPGSFLGFGTAGVGTEVLVSVLVVIILINSFNLIDGIDGLASGIGMLSSAMFGLVFFGAGQLAWALMAAVLCGSLAGFTWFNVISRKKKIYMGDTGSLILGFLIALMALQFINLDSPAFFRLPITAPLGFVLALLMIPLFDILRIIILRIVQGRSPFRPDRQHIHYRIVDSGASHMRATGILLGINIIMIVLAFLLQGLEDIPLILLLLALAGFLSAVPVYIMKRKRRQNTRVK